MNLVMNLFQQVLPRLLNKAERRELWWYIVKSFLSSKQETIKRWRNCELSRSRSIIKGILRSNRPCCLSFPSLFFSCPLFNWCVLCNSLFDFTLRGRLDPFEKKKDYVSRRYRVHHSADNLMSLAFSESWWHPNWNMLNRWISHLKKKEDEG